MFLNGLMFYFGDLLVHTHLSLLTLCTPNVYVALHLLLPMQFILFTKVMT